MTAPRRAGAIAAGAVLAAAAGVAHRARYVTPYSPVLEQVEIRVPDGAGAPDGLRIGFVADTHIGPVIRPADIERALTLLMAARPDVLLLGGDYVCESPRHLPDAADVLGNFAGAVRFGAVAVLGNHDHSNDPSRLTALFEKRGIRILRNEAAHVAGDAGGLWIAGIDDAMLGSPDPRRAFSGVPAGARALALWHEPDWAEQVAALGALAQLSGHSHGGQVRLPAVGPIAAPPGGRRFVAGLNNAAGMPLYTSRGVGVFRPPVRFRCPSEVTLVTLVMSHCGCRLPPSLAGAMLRATSTD